MATTYQRASASNLSKEQVFSLAESVAEQLEFEPGDDIVEVVEKLGGAIKIQDTLLEDSEHTGSLFVEGGNDFKIVIPSHTSPQRDRFTIAHELGHYILHYLFPKDKGVLVEKMMAMRRDSHRVEWEANWFAAGFLMPNELFKKRFEKFDGDLNRVASYFAVSKSAAEIRAKSLGLID